MKSLKLGVLGVSNHFITRVLQPLKNCQFVELYGISSRSGDRAEKLAREYNIPKYYSSYDDLLKDKSIDMVYIPLPNHLHAEWIKKSADHGKHILCEKPIALNAGEAKEAIDYANSKNVKIMEAFMYRFHPQWQYARDIIKYKTIGNVQSIHIFFGFNNVNPDNIRNIKDYGGGAILDIGCYAVSSSRFLFGEEPVRVVSLNSFDSNFKTDILCSSIIDFKEARTVFTVSTQTFSWQKVEVHCTGGVMSIEIPFNPFPDCPMKIIIKTDVATRIVEFDPADHYKIEFEEFAKAILEDREVPLSNMDSINNMKVLDALFKSGESGSWVNL
jgi:predicted dehydrogenase